MYVHLITMIRYLYNFTNDTNFTLVYFNIKFKIKWSYS